MTANLNSLSPADMAELLAIKRRKVELREGIATEAEKEQRVTRTLARIADQNDARQLLARVAPRTPKAPEGMSREQAELIANDPLLQYCLFQSGKGGMSPGQRRIHVAQGANRLVRAANQVGKTHGICAEILWQWLGWHPWRQIKRKLRVSYCIIKDFESGYHEFCAKLRALLPPDALHKNCQYSMSTGFSYLEAGHRRPWLVHKDGYRIEFKSGTQDSMALESATVDAVFFDEPPKYEHWSAARARLSVSNGPTLIAFTAVGRPLDWLKREIEGDPKTGRLPAESWESVVIPLSIETSPHRTPESIAAQIARNEASGQSQQRTEGGWEGVTEGRRFKAFTARHCERTAAELIATYKISEFRLGADWGEGPKKTAIHLIGLVKSKAEPGKPVLWTYLVLGEYVSQETTTPAMDAKGTAAMIKAVGINPAQIAQGRGDINSMGKGGPGQSVNAAFEAAFTKEIGVRVCPFKMVVPDKSKGSVDLGHSMISHAIMEDPYFVATECESLIQSFNHFTDGGTAKDEGYKHALDGARYGIDDTFEQPDTSATRYRDLLARISPPR